MPSLAPSRRALRVARTASLQCNLKLNTRGGAAALRLVVCALVGCVALCLCAGGAAAAALTVNSTADGAVANDGQCTLREAMTNANNDNQSGSTDCAAGSGADTINITATGTITLTSALPSITTAMTINGPGAAQLTVSGNNAVRVFNVQVANPLVMVAFAGLTIADGLASNSFGGGIYNVTGTVNVINSTLSSNSATNGGGGIYNGIGTINVTNSMLSSNSAPFGGGILNIGQGTINVTNSTLSGNSSTPAGGGGGIFNNAQGTINVTNSTLSGNSAPGSFGGGIAGGSMGMVNVINSTFSGNSATNGGGGIYNGTGTVKLGNSLVAGNTATSGDPDLYGMATSQGYNLVGIIDGNANITATTGDQFGTTVAPLAPLLGPLQNNGGPTFTRALLPGSPAIDKGKDLSLTGTDQRGFTRPFDDPTIVPATSGDNSDIGAFEVQPEFTISGTITFAGNPLASVTVTASGALAATTQTDASGNYTFGNLPAGMYTVTPTKIGFTFTPANRSVTLSSTNATGQNFTATSTLTNAQPTNGPVLISEYRLQGPTPAASPAPGNTSGELDEFIELYNNSNATVNISGYQLAASTGNTIPLPAFLLLPPRTHFLIANAGGYSLGGYATPDQTYTGFDLPLNAGLVLLNGASQIVDAVGQTTSAAPYKEGTGITPISGSGQYSFVRKLTSGTPQDTGDNRADFAFVATDAGQFGRTTTTPGPDGSATLGTPGPENLASPVQHNATIKAQLIDPGCAGSAAAPTQACPRYRSLASVTNGSQGTLSIRRRFINNTGAAVTRLRFRVVDITTMPAPAGMADLRALTSADQPAVCQGTGNGCPGVAVPITINGTTLEEPPTQTLGGGLNSTLATGTITLDTPLGAGAGINLQFLLGVQQGGSYRFLINVEAVTNPPSLAKPSRTGKLSATK